MGIERELVMSSKSIAEILEPNVEDENGPYWDPWSALGISCASYSSQIDADAIHILKAIASRQFNSDIAVMLGLPEQYVELLQSIFCSAGWCDYGTSPRGCFPAMDWNEFQAIISAWEAYYDRQWNNEK